MGVSKNIYGLFTKFKSVISKETFKIAFVSIFGMFIFFGTFNTYAQVLSPSWEGTKIFHNTASEADEDEDNMNSREGTEALNSAWTVFSLLAPELTSAEALAPDDRIPYDLRRGLLGLTDDAATAAYAMYPKISVYDHLAQQWVPGYNPGTVGIYAADSGYVALQSSGIDLLWIRVVNLSYILFVIIMIVAGFMIMFRHKLGGQTVVTLGTVLPRVIISLLLATFSFAIAGLVIDFVGFLNGFVAYVLGGADGVQPIYGLGNLMQGAIGGWDDLPKIFLKFAAFGVWKKDSAIGILNLIKEGFKFLINPVGQSLKIGFWGLLIGSVVIGIVFLGAIRVVIILFKSYFQLLLSVIIAPIQITLGAIPGNSKMIKNWFFSLLRSAMVFPVVLFIVNLPNILEGNLAVNLPSKLVFQEGDNTWFSNIDVAMIVELFFRVFVLFFAAQAPKFLEAVFPPDKSQAFAEAMGGAKTQMSKIPLIGKVFKEKRR